MHIINNTINGSQFSNATIDGSVLESKTLIQSDIANDAVVAGKFSNSINIDGKISSSANIARGKLIDDAVTAEKLSFVFDADDTSKIASDAVTDGKLASNQLFDTTKVQDGSIKLDKIATGQLSSFASNTLTAADFDKDSSSDNIKIGRKQIKAGNKIKTKQITTAKIKTDSALPNASLSDSSIENSDFADDSISSGDIEDGTITSKQLADTDFGTSRLPEFNGNKFEALSSAQIENNIFDADDFPNQYFQSHHIASMDAAKLKTDAITGDKVKDGEIGASKFSTGILTDGSIVANSITSDKIKNGVLQAAHLKSNAITGAKFKDGTLTAADFDTSNTDGIFSDGTIATSIHEHNPYNFQRVETNTDFTLLQSSSRGRANFSYRIKDSQTLTDAQETCKNENSQLCDINQLIDICRNSAGVDDAFYFAGEPVLISEKTKDYFVFPMLKDSNNDCFDPEITYDVYAEEPVPVKVNFLTGSSGVHDITSYKGEYFVKINDEVYHDSEAYIAPSTSAMANSVHTDNKASAHFVYNSGVSNDSLYMTSSTKIKRISGPSNGSFSFTESTSTYVDIKDLDFFRSASTSIPSSGIILEGSDAYRIVDQNGDAETSSKILLVTSEEKLFPNDDSTYADWQNYQYKYVNEGANFSDSTCDTGSSLAAAHSKDELDHRHSSRD